MGHTDIMLKKNISFSLLTNVARLILGSLIFIILSRVFELTVFGKYVYLIVVTGYFSIFTDFGFNLSILNDLPKNKEKVKNYFYEIVFSKTILTIFSFIGFIVYLWLFGETSEISIPLIFMLVAILQSFSSLLSHIFKAFNRFDKDFYYVLITSIFLLSSIYFFKDDLSLKILALLLLCSRIMGIIYLLYVFKSQFYKCKVVGTINLNLIPLKKNIKYAVHMIIGGLLLSIDIPIMKEILSLEHVAIYSAGMKLFVALILVADVMIASFIPKLSENKQKNNILFERMVQKLTYIIFTLGTILGLTIVLFGDYLVPIIYGEKYEQLILLMPYFGIALFIRYFSMLYGMLITLAGKQHIRAFLIVTVFFVHIFLNIVLQINLGIEGALISFCASFSMLTVISMIIVKRHYGKIFILRI